MKSIEKQKKMSAANYGHKDEGTLPLLTFEIIQKAPLVLLKTNALIWMPSKMLANVRNLCKLPVEYLWRIAVDLSTRHIFPHKAEHYATADGKRLHFIQICRKQ